MQELLHREVGHMNATVRDNIDYYDALYSCSSRWMFLCRALVSFDQQSKARRNYKASRRWLCPPTTRAPRVLDYGSGWGTFLLKWPRGTELYCHDIASIAMDRLVDIGAAIGKNIRVASVDEEGLPNAVGNGYDLILCSHVLEHVPSDDVLVGRMTAALVDNGTLVVNVPINEVWNDPKHVRRYDNETAIRLLRRHGLTICDVAEVDCLTAHLLKASQSGELWRHVLQRGLRLLFGLLPCMADAVERLLPATNKPQQLIVVARRIA